METDYSFYQNLNQRLQALEEAAEKLGPAEKLLERITQLEETLYAYKNILTQKEAAMYLGISESSLYCLTSANEIPYYKPHGKLNYFRKDELDIWLLQNHNPFMNKTRTKSRRD